MQVPQRMVGTAVVMLALFAGPSHAQTRADPPLANTAVCGAERIIPCPWADLVQFLEEIARPRLVDYSRPQRDYPEPETAEEKRRRLLSPEDTEAVVLVGAIAGIAAWCEVTKEHVVLGRLLAEVESVRTLSDVSFSYLVSLANAAAGWYRRTSEKSGNCTPKGRALVEDALRGLWPRP